MAKNNKPDSKNVTPHRRLLAASEKERMMAIALRNEVVFYAAKEILKPEHFDAEDAIYAVAWRVLLAYEREYQGLPDRSLMMSELDVELDQNPGELTRDEISSLEAFIDVCYDPTAWSEDLQTSVKYEKNGLTLLKRFLSERLALETFATVKATGRIASRFSEFLNDKVSEAQLIDSLDQPTSSVLYPEGWDQTPGLDLKSTGLKFVDDFLDGGDAAGEVYGVLGPYGSAKTTLAIALAAEDVTRARDLTKKDNYDGKHYYTFFFSYESPLQELRIRFMAYQSRVQRKRLQMMGKEGIKSLAGRGEVMPYETTDLAAKAKEGLEETQYCEQERVAKALQELNGHLIVRDMTGFDPENAGAGGGYIEEIERIVKSELRRRGPQAACGKIFIDYVGAMARRYCQARGVDEAVYLRHLIGGAPMRAKNLLAAQFRTRVYLLHQLKAQENGRRPGTLSHHSSAAEAANFGENLDYAFVIGTPTKENRFQFVATKHRRSSAQEARIIHLDGDYGRLYDDSASYSYTPQTGIVANIDLKTTASSDQAQAAAAKAAKLDEKNGKPDPAKTVVAKPKAKSKVGNASHASLKVNQSFDEK